MVHAFLTLVTKKIDPQKLGSTGEQKMLESLKNYAKLKEYKFTLQWVRPRLHMLNVQNDPWIIYFTVTPKIMDTRIFKKGLSSSKLWILEKIARQIWYQKMSKISTFCRFCTASYTENIENASLKLETEIAYADLTSRRVISHRFHKRFPKFLQFLPENLQHTQ